MNWTHESPKEPGWYWLRMPEGEPPVVIEVIRRDGRLWADRGGWRADIRGLAWAGPIPEPEQEA